MTNLGKAAQQALVALECMIDDLMYKDHKRVIDISNVAITALRTALEQQAEPVAWMFQHDETGRMNYVGNDGIHNPTMFLEMNPRYALVCPLYTTPPQREWQSLTDEDWEKVVNRKNTVLDTFEQGATWAAYKLERRNK